MFASLRKNRRTYNNFVFSSISFFLGAVLLLSILIKPSQVVAAAPTIINHQGRLLDSSGNLLGGSSGTNYCFRFSFYDDPTVGAPDNKLWPSATPQKMTVLVKNGIFNVGIGDTSVGGDTLDFDFNSTDEVYLNIEVANSSGGSCVGVSSFETLSPRQRINSSGYALNANSVAGFIPAQSATDDEIPVLTNGTLILGSTSAGLSATSTNALTFQSGVTGDLQFFSNLNKITSTGDLTLAGSATITGLSLNLGSDATGDMYYRDAGGNFERLPIGGNGEALVVSGGLPSWETLPGGGDAFVANPLSQFATTTSLQLSGVISDETGSGALVFANSPTFSGTVSGITAAMVGAPSGSGTSSGTNTGDQDLSPYLLIANLASSETDPVFLSSDVFTVTSADILNWDTAYGWGDHAGAGYLTSFTELDPIFTASDAAGITATDITNLGNLSGVNTGDQDLSPYLLISGLAAAETDPIFIASDAFDITATDIVNLGNLSGTNTGDQDLSGLLVKANNLSDLANTGTARTNLGLGTLATQNGTFSGTSSGTNTGDQTSIVGITGSLSDFNTALTGADFATGGGTATGTNTGDNAVNTLYSGLATSKQDASTNLTSLSGLSYVSPSFVKMTAAGTFALDTNTYLTSFTETDPIFTASDAASITATDITNLSNLSGTNTGDQTSVTGNAGTVTFADAGGDTTTFVALGTNATGSLSPATDAGLTYNATTNALTATTFIGGLTGNVTGNADTATALAANPSDCGANTFATTIAANGNLTCASLTDADVPNSITVDTATLAGTVTVVDSTDATSFVAIFDSATGSLAPKTDGALLYDASNGTLTATTFSGNLTGNVTGNVSGSSGSTTGNAATATALQNARNINGVSFNGTADITVTAAAGTLSGATLNGTVTASSLTSVGTLTGGATGAGFTMNFGTSTLSGDITSANISGLDISSDTNLTAGDGAILTGDDVAVDLKTVGENGVGSTQSVSGMEFESGQLTLLQGCADNEILKWDETDDDWNCEADNAGGGISDADYGDIVVSGSGAALTIDTGVVSALKLQNAAADLGAANVTVNFGNTNGAFNTNITTDGSVTAGSFIGGLTGNVTGNADTATALAANPSDCGANTFATTIAANGNLTCASIADADVPNNITVDLATLASSVTNATLTTALTVNTGTVTLTGNAANNSVLTLGAGASSISGSHSGTSSGTNTGDQTITLTGDVTGSGTGSFAATIGSDAVALGTDTTGNYVEGATSNGGLTLTGTEGGTLGIALASSGTTGSTSSNSGLEVGSGGLSLLKGCNDGQLLEWTDAGGWACANDDAGGGLSDADYGDITVSGTGTVFTIDTSAITTAKILDGTIDADDLDQATADGAPADEECLTFETSGGGDFEWQSCGGGSFDSTAVDATTWSDGANASNVWTFDVSGTDHTMTASSGLMTFGDAVTVTDTLTANGGLALGSSTITGAGLTDCDSGTSILLWDATSSQFSCGVDNDLIALVWSEVNLTANVNNVQLDRPNSTNLNTATSEMYMPYAGSVDAIEVGGSAARTAGTATFKVYANNGDTGLWAVINASNTQYVRTTQASGTDTFTAGQQLDVRALTDGTFAPTTAEWVATVFVQMNEGADLAELYNVTDTTIESGDVVAMNPELTDGVQKTSRAYDKNTFGVIATKPGLLLGHKEVPDISMSRAVALAGRVPVKVSTENGPIEPGDYLTPSTTPGVAMRATKAGPVIGQAMSWFDEDDTVGRVAMFIKNGYFNGERIEETADKSILVQLLENKEVLAAGDPELLSTVTTDQVVAGLEVITPTVTADTIDATKVTLRNNLGTTLELSVESINTLSSAITQLQTDREAFIAKDTEFTTRSDEVTAKITAIETALQNGIFTVDNMVTMENLNVTGNATFGGESRFNGLSFFDNATTFAQNVLFTATTEFTVPPLFNADTAGFAVIKEGSRKVEVVFDNAYIATPVVNTSISFEDDEIDETAAEELFAAGIQSIVMNKSANGFTILLNKNAPRDIRFSWAALSVKDAKIFEGIIPGLVIEESIPEPDPIPDPGIDDTGTPPESDPVDTGAGDPGTGEPTPEPDPIPDPGTDDTGTPPDSGSDTGTGDSGTGGTTPQSDPGAV